MTTPRTRCLVSLAALTLTLGGCVSAPSRLALDGPAPIGELARTVRFDNEARDYVHVYLVGVRQEWLLGRVAPGARAMLRIPDAVLADDAGPIRLAVLVGSVTLRAAGDARAATTVAQRATEVLSQRWAFSQMTATGQLTGLHLGRERAEVGRR